MVGLIEWQITWLEFLRSLDCSKHRVECLVVKRLSDVELNDLSGLFQVCGRFQMFEFHVILDV